MITGTFSLCLTRCRFCVAPANVAHDSQILCEQGWGSARVIFRVIRCACRRVAGLIILPRDGWDER